MIEKLKEFIEPLREKVLKSPTTISNDYKNAYITYNSYLTMAEDTMQEPNTKRTIVKDENNYTDIVFTQDGPLLHSVEQLDYYPPKKHEVYQGFLKYDNEKVFVNITIPERGKHYNGCKGYVIRSNGFFEKVLQKPTMKDPNYPDIDKLMKDKFERLNVTIKDGFIEHVND